MAPPAYLVIELAFIYACDHGVRWQEAKEIAAIGHDVPDTGPMPGRVYHQIDRVGYGYGWVAMEVENEVVV